jgi:hypothetical protein
LLGLLVSSRCTICPANKIKKKKEKEKEKEKRSKNGQPARKDGVWISLSNKAHM